jgi:hypothetical protein
MISAKQNDEKLSLLFLTDGRAVQIDRWFTRLESSSALSSRSL